MTFPSMKRRPRAVQLTSLCLAAAIVLSGCTQGKSEGSAGSGDEKRTVKSAKGDIQVPKEPKRIVVLTGGLAGYAFRLEAPVAATDTRVLGVTDLKGEFPPSWADPATKQGTKALPGGEELSVEAVAAAKPDLIIGGGQGISAVQADKRYDDLKAIAPTVLVPTSVTDWKEQLRMVADAAGRTKKADELIEAYTKRVAEVKAKIKVPEGKTAVMLSLQTKEPSLVPSTAALPSLLKEVGFDMDDVYEKADKPKLYGSGDSFNVSKELLPKVADAPNTFVIPVGGPKLAELQADPVYSQLPSFTGKKVNEFPATSYRPDYDSALQTLDLLEKTFS
ncbi:iron complex transport system substrate-binding protein [Austwickia chelonae]|uniref:Putative iron-siderophore binding protein n=1 Tax=Austwickia chelonae NBRC 105200 TaxID=1184607 RepID=K6VT54_9MICO|nr:ABC transporter substrate-binding protein [Austwickia chelonae]GAB78485.1 putative iron-siderophore binding protein [Austwickia chelonae NBRC 105200]SEW40038.1 iron complex transport system substrate-binding protein [Austwickia chelonae]